MARARAAARRDSQAAARLAATGWVTALKKLLPPLLVSRREKPRGTGQIRHGRGPYAALQRRSITNTRRRDGWSQLGDSGENGGARPRPAGPDRRSLNGRRGADQRLVDRGFQLLAAI